MYNAITKTAEIVKKHPELNSDFNWYEMTRQEKQEHWLVRYNHMKRIDEDFFFTKALDHGTFLTLALFPGSSPFTLHSTMFCQTIKELGSESQIKKWLPQALSFKMLGCYAQTELGHGSNVQGMETTATLDKKTDEWVIHTPTITATKFWPGNLGVHSNHAMVFARCIVDEYDHGPQPFMVQIRSMEDHMPLQGVRVGDLGMKLGYNSVDNGWLAFDHKRIPRKNMMKRFCVIDKDGGFEMKGDPRLVYKIMINSRLSLLKGSSLMLYRSCQIATRYAAVRRQFSTVPGTK
jgi:acyl-CoA oxidase